MKNIHFIMFHCREVMSSEPQRDVMLLHAFAFQAGGDYTILQV